MAGSKRKADHSIQEVIELLDSDEEDCDIAPLAFKRDAGSRQNTSHPCSSQETVLSQGEAVTTPTITGLFEPVLYLKLHAHFEHYRIVKPG